MDRLLVKCLIKSMDGASSWLAGQMRKRISVYICISQAVQSYCLRIHSSTSLHHTADKNTREATNTQNGNTKRLNTNPNTHYKYNAA